MPAEDTARWVRLGTALALAWFAARLFAYAWAIDPGVPPDEATHLGRILFHARSLGLPTPRPEDHALGLLQHRPFLYSWALGRLAALGLDGLLALRCVNAGLALGTACYGLGFVRLVSEDPRVHLVFTVLLTNTLMFTGIGAAVSYDNGTNLLAAAGFYHAGRFLRDGEPGQLGALLLALGLGCLTKRSFLPLAAALVPGVAFLGRQRLREAVTPWALRARPLLWAAVAAVLVTNAGLYGSNLARFGRLVPRFEQVVGEEAARANRIFARDAILDGYREGRLGFEEALRATGEIDHPGDRRSTRLQLLAMRQRLARGEDARMGGLRYAGWWATIMLDRATGYFGHRVIRRSGWERAAFAAVFGLALALHGRARLRARREGSVRPGDRLLALGGGVALAYALVLLLLVNRPVYLEKGILDAGVQGRYLFPVWVPWMALVAVGLWRDAPRSLRVPLAGAACALFLWSDAPTLLLRAGSGWFGS